MLFLSWLLTSFVSVSWIEHESQFLAFSHGADPMGAVTSAPEELGWGTRPGLDRSSGSHWCQLESSSESPAPQLCSHSGAVLINLFNCCCRCAERVLRAPQTHLGADPGRAEFQGEEPW